MTHDLIPATRHHGHTLPALFAPNAPAAKRVLEFFTANFRNPNTRKTYAKATSDFAANRHSRNGTARQSLPKAGAAPSRARNS